MSTVEDGAMIALVTGGNRGIGREVCRRLADLGHTVLLTARSPDAARAAAEDVGGGAVPMQFDVTSGEDVTRAAVRSPRARPGSSGPPPCPTAARPADSSATAAPCPGEPARPAGR
ncbi:SDR family NAD(P)-dependent oxidoreductase [Actinomadura sp. 21ATH]|uniref:SDR family NAD(P)-dependent oxidoreductase n=1 Tax=Actinomadura sp. 21ATH TaxID=1735444 RepID=UPI0035C1533F